MAAAFDLTRNPIRVTAAQVQPIWLSLDVGEFEQLEFHLFVPAVEATVCNGVQINIRTGMQFETESGWFNLLYFPTFRVSNFCWRACVTGGFQRYVRWNVAAIGSATAVTFTIRGCGR